MAAIVKIDGVYKLPETILEGSPESRFDYIYNAGVWSSGSEGESVSGSGSTIKNTELYREQLGQFLKAQGDHVLTFFDAPCGDLNWVQGFFEDFDYIGGDISGDLITRLRLQYPDVSVSKFDITKDTFPDADLWHCRHCLFHLSLHDIVLALENFAKSSIQACIITSHFLPDKITFDIPTGSFRPLDLTNFPFYLPTPKIWLLDSHPLGGKLAMASGLWSRSDIEAGIRNYYKFTDTEIGSQ